MIIIINFDLLENCNIYYIEVVYLFIERKCKLISQYVKYEINSNSLY